MLCYVQCDVAWSGLIWADREPKADAFTWKMQIYKPFAMLCSMRSGLILADLSWSRTQKGPGSPNQKMRLSRLWNGLFSYINSQRAQNRICRGVSSQKCPGSPNQKMKVPRLWNGLFSYINSQSAQNRFCRECELPEEPRLAESENEAPAFMKWPVFIYQFSENPESIL